MALVYCSQCGQQIADTAPTCPQCGAPGATAARQVASKKKGNPTLQIALACLTFLIGLGTYNSGNKPQGMFFMLTGLIVGAYSIYQKNKPSL